MRLLGSTGWRRTRPWPSKRPDLVGVLICSHITAGIIGWWLLSFHACR